MGIASALSKRIGIVICAGVLAFACGVFATQEAYAAGVTTGGSNDLGGQSAIAPEYNPQTASTTNVFRIYNKWSGEHLFTTDWNEVMDDVSVGWTFEGVSFVSAGRTSVAYTKENNQGDRVYAAAVNRLYNPYNGEHHYTMNADEVASLTKIGWKDEGVIFYAYDKEVYYQKEKVDGDTHTTEQAKMPGVYREFNPYATTGTHNYTQDANEHKSVVAAGWKDEGVAWYATPFEEHSYRKVDGKWQDVTDRIYSNSYLYRLYNPYSGEHFYTVNPSETAKLVSAGWKYEGVTYQTFGASWWSADNNEGATQDYCPVYRAYNPYSGDHHFTADKAEIDNLVKAGWKDEGMAFAAMSTDVYKKKVENKDNVSGYSPVYRAFNKNVTIGSHNFTMDNSEQKNLVNAGWKDEGVAWYASDVNENNTWRWSSLGMGYYN